MRSDLTIYLVEPLLTEGGTVVVLPRETAEADWPGTESKPNPALDDKTLPALHPLQPADRRIGVVARDRVTVVQFAIPVGGTFVLRFAPDPAIQPPPAHAGTKQIGVGSSETTDPETGEIEKFPKILSFHVAGRSTTEADSREAEARLRLGTLEKRYRCEIFDGAIACAASKGAIDG